MESAKLKNIALLILVITNLLLGLLMVIQGVNDRQRQTRPLADAVALLADRGITVDADVLPQSDFPSPMTLERDNTWERTMFAALLGDDLTTTQRGLVSYYESDLGRAEAREDGSFTVTFTDGAFPLNGQEIATHGPSVLKQMEFDAAVTSAEENSLEVVQLFGGVPVYSCTATLHYKNGALSQLDGVRLVGAPTADLAQSAPLSIATLLLRFRSGIIDSGDACSAIRSATQGYILSSSPAGKLRLTPVLRLETDTGAYLVDALTGALSRA